MKSLRNINKIVGKQEDPLPATPFILGNTNFTFRDRVFQHPVSLIDNEIDSTYNMCIENDIRTILDILSISFKYIEVIEYKIDNKRIQLSIANTNRLKVLRAFRMLNEQTMLFQKYSKPIQGRIIPRIIQTPIGYFFHLLKTNTRALCALGILKPSRSQHCLDY